MLVAQQGKYKSGSKVLDKYDFGCEIFITITSRMCSHISPILNQSADKFTEMGTLKICIRFFSECSRRLVTYRMQHKFRFKIQMAMERKHFYEWQNGK